MNHHVWKSFAAHEVSHSVAHYLTTLHDLHRSHGYARVSDVARELQVTKGSVSVQMKHLKEKGWVTEDENRFLQLTELGESVAVEVKYNRDVLIRFMSTVLGLAPEQAETDACKIEHLLSTQTSRQILALVQLLQSDDPDAKKLVKRFKNFEFRCPSMAECKLCDEQCLNDVEPCSRMSSLGAAPLE
jgi:DtxR family transcriptional regulator, Mn-dependent transcriptional regulator